MSVYEIDIYVAHAFTDQESSDLFEARPLGDTSYPEIRPHSDDTIVHFMVRGTTQRRALMEAFDTVNAVVDDIVEIDIARTEK